MATIGTTDAKGNDIATHEDRVQASQWALETFRALGREDLIDHLTVEWSTRFTSRLGDACYIDVTAIPSWRKLDKKFDRNVVDGKVCRLRFSAPIWPLADETQRYETVVHEVAHLVTSHEANLANRGKPQSHGYEWKSVMLRAGISPKTTHSVDVKGLKGKKTRKTDVAHCECKDHEITPAMAKKIGNGSLYICRSCKGYLLLGSMHSHLPAVEAPKVEAPTATVINGFTIPTPAAMGF